MAIIVPIIIAGAENDHSTRLGHSRHLLVFLLKVIAKDVAAHGHICKLVWERDVGDEAVHWIDVGQPPSLGFRFEIVAQISLPDTFLFCHEFHELTRRWRQKISEIRAIRGEKLR